MCSYLCYAVLALAAKKANAKQQSIASSNVFDMFWITTTSRNYEARHHRSAAQPDLLGSLARLMETCRLDGRGSKLDDWLLGNPESEPCPSLPPSRIQLPKPSAHRQAFPRLGPQADAELHLTCELEVSWQ